MHVALVNHLISSLELSTAEEPAGPPAAVQEQAQPDLPVPISGAPSLTTPLHVVTNATAYDTNAAGQHGASGVGESSGEHATADGLSDAPIARQSSIFKLLSPSAPSFGSPAPPSLPSSDPFHLISQDAQAEVEAMI